MSIAGSILDRKDVASSSSISVRGRESLASCVAGIVAGATGILLGHPFDTIRVRMQVSGGTSSSASTPSSPSLSFANKIRQLYRGAVPPACSSGLLQGMNFTVYEYMRSSTSLWSSYYSSVFVSGAVAGAALSVVVTPINLLKIQQQTAPSSAPLTLRDCVRAIYNRSGLKGFYCGYRAAALAEVPGRGIYMLLYEMGKVKFGHMWSTYSIDRSRSVSDKENSRILPVQIGAASAAGAGSWIAVYPIDVVKCRLQADIDGSRYRNSAVTCIRQTYAAGGIRMFYRGISYTVLRAIPVSAVILPMYEATREHTLHLLRVADSLTVQ